MAIFRFVKNYGYTLNCEIEADSFEEACEIMEDVVEDDWEKDVDGDYFISSCAQLIDEESNMPQEEYEWTE